MPEPGSGITSSHPILPDRFPRRSTGGRKPWMKKPGPTWMKRPSRRVRRCSLRVPPPAPVLRAERRWPKKKKVDVLMFLLHHKVNIAEARVRQCRPEPFGPVSQSRVRSGMPRPHQLPYDTTIFRPPTYEEAEQWFKIPKATMTSWWEKRHKYLPASEFEFEKTMFDPPPEGRLAKDSPRPATFLQSNMLGVGQPQEPIDLGPNGLPVQHHHKIPGAVNNAAVTAQQALNQPVLNQGAAQTAPIAINDEEDDDDDDDDVDEIEDPTEALQMEEDDDEEEEDDDAMDDDEEEEEEDDNNDNGMDNGDGDIDDDDALERELEAQLENELANGSDD